MEPARPRHIIALWSILLSSLALKIKLAYYSETMGIFGDPAMYIRMSRTWAEGGGFTVDEANLWPPGHIVWLGMHWRHLGEELLNPKLSQCVLATITVYFFYRIARHTLEKTWLAIAATGLIAFYPTLIAFTHYLWAETLYLFFFGDDDYFIFIILCCDI